MVFMEVKSLRGLVKLIAGMVLINPAVSSYANEKPIKDYFFSQNEYTHVILAPKNHECVKDTDGPNPFIASKFQLENLEKFVKGVVGFGSACYLPLPSNKNTDVHQQNMPHINLYIIKFKEKKQAIQLIEKNKEESFLSGKTIIFLEKDCNSPWCNEEQKDSIEKVVSGYLKRIGNNNSNNKKGL